MSKIEDKSKFYSKSGKSKIDPIKSQKMASYRIIQKNLVYVIGISEKLASKELLGKYEYFGQYGQISKIIVNKHKAYYAENQSRPSYSVYISFSNSSEAALAILAIDSIMADDHLIRASFGTTKYCSFYLKNLDCPNKDCLYIHHLADDELIVNKEEFNSTQNTFPYKNIFYEQHLLAIKLANLYDKDIKKTLSTSKNLKKSIFPNLESIYAKDIVVKNDPEKKNKIIKNKINLSNDKKIYNFSLSENETPKNGKINFEEKNISSDENEKINLIEKFNSDGIQNLNENEIMKENINENIINNLKENLNENYSSPTIKNSLYRNRDKSRFTFVPINDEESNENKFIPDYVFDVINKKVSRYSFFKKFENQFELENIKNDKIYFEESFLKCGHNKNDSWKDFIFTNLNSQN